MITATRTITLDATYAKSRWDYNQDWKATSPEEPDLVVMAFTLEMLMYRARCWVRDKYIGTHDDHGQFIYEVETKIPTVRFENEIQKAAQSDDEERPLRGRW